MQGRPCNETSHRTFRDLHVRHACIERFRGGFDRDAERCREAMILMMEVVKEP